MTGRNRSYKYKEERIGMIQLRRRGLAAALILCMLLALLAGVVGGRMAASQPVTLEVKTSEAPEAKAASAETEDKEV